MGEGPLPMARASNLPFPFRVLMVAPKSAYSSIPAELRNGRAEILHLRGLFTQHLAMTPGGGVPGGLFGSIDARRSPGSSQIFAASHTYALHVRSVLSEPRGVVRCTEYRSSCKTWGWGPRRASLMAGITMTMG